MNEFLVDIVYVIIIIFSWELGQFISRIKRCKECKKYILTRSNTIEISGEGLYHLRCYKK